jgi:hypothetical protein
MRQRGSETAPRFLKCRRLERGLARPRQASDQFASISERSCLEQMVSYLARALVDAAAFDTLDSVGSSSVQLLAPM